ncbi:MAG TPA: UBP-type zinc finger domain-containing protein [Terriglobales bacterium]|nr:UBP-type zinc finger domain-containing protein [Terriglobales bacterium]
MAKCEHLKQANPKVQASGDVCQGCVDAGLRWVELRQCLICGHVGCCDSSPGRHADKHFKETGHPVMQAFKAGDWKWCYVHESYM